MHLNISKKTKIVCTIGPATQTPEMVRKLYSAGMTVMRINFSHGTHEEQLNKIKIARSFEKEGIYIPVALDTKGPEIRTGYMEGGKIPVKTGQVMRISMEDCLGNAERFSVSHAGLYDDVEIGNHILIDDGNLDFKVTGKDEAKRELIVEAQNNHVLKDQKGVNAPFSRLSMPFISEKDEKDLAFGCEQHVDAIFASFVRRPEDIQDIRACLAKYGDPTIPIFAKIGKTGGFIQLGDNEKSTGEKPRFAPLPDGVDVNSVTLDQALAQLALPSLPRLLGPASDGTPLIAAAGPFGPYLKAGKYNLPIKDYDPYTIDLATAQSLYQAKLDSIIADFGDIMIINGAYGPYIKGPGRFNNVKIPKDRDPKSIAKAEAEAMLAAKPARRGRAKASTKSKAKSKSSRARKSTKSRAKSTKKPKK